MLVSGGHGGLVRCSVVPPHVTVQRMPSYTKYNFAAAKRRSASKIKASAGGAATSPRGPPAAKKGKLGLVEAVKVDPESGKIVPASSASAGSGPAAGVGAGGAVISETTGGSSASAATVGDVVSPFGPAAAASPAAVPPFASPEVGTTAGSDVGVAGVVGVGGDEARTATPTAASSIAGGGGDGGSGSGDSSAGATNTVLS